MRIDNTHSVSESHVLKNQILQQSRFARSRRTDDVRVLESRFIGESDRYDCLPVLCQPDYGTLAEDFVGQGFLWLCRTDQRIAPYLVSGNANERGQFRKRKKHPASM